MKANYKREDFIDLYLLGKLSPQERKEFEEEILRDDSLQKEVENMQRIMMGFERKGESDAMSALCDTSEEQVKSIIISAEKRHKLPAKKTWLIPTVTAVAASIALLLYIGFQPEYSSEELYNSFYAPFVYEYAPSRSGALNDEQEHLLEQAIAEYDEGRYAEASILFDSITSNMNSEQIPEQVTFYASLCMVQTGKELAALEKLEAIATSTDSEFKDDAQWNLALVYLKLKEREKCSSILYDITNEKNSPYTNDANKLLEKLETKRWF